MKGTDRFHEIRMKTTNQVPGAFRGTSAHVHGHQELTVGLGL